jgi:AraC-like DNA-binding protein
MIMPCLSCGSEERERRDRLAGQVTGQRHPSSGWRKASSHDAAWIHPLKKERIHLKNVTYASANTPSYLSNLFHRKTGTTFVKYLIKLRILKAKELLSVTNLPVQQVAERVGYYSTRYFTKLFVEAVGIYPSEYRVKQGRIRRKQIASDTTGTGGEVHVANQSQENC